MKYLTILVDSIRVKGDVDDEDQLRADVYEKLQAMIEAETLTFQVDEENDDEEDPFL